MNFVMKPVTILWAVSSVGLGHVMRDMSIAAQLQGMADVRIDWLAPYPAGNYLHKKGHRVLSFSSHLAGSGKTYAQVFEGCSSDFNLMRYLKADTRLHRHDFTASSRAWEEKAYDVIVGDEAFWLLTGFASEWAAKPAPFVFMTDFIGVKSMHRSISDTFTAWVNNLKFSMSHAGPDVYLYIGDAAEIPGGRMGLFLPSRRRWAERHCRFVKPVIGFDPGALPGKQKLREQLGLPETGKLFLATVAPFGDMDRQHKDIEAVLDLLRGDHQDATFIMVSPKTGTKAWIRYHAYVEGLYQYFAAADFVLTQAGYGKVIELSALGTPFIVLPLDHHFEQEYMMAHRLGHYGTGKLMTVRDHTPPAIALAAQQVMEKGGRKIAADNGTEIAGIILEAAHK